MKLELKQDLGGYKLRKSEYFIKSKKKIKVKLSQDSVTE
jgi:hypothetical protein